MRTMLARILLIEDNAVTRMCLIVRLQALKYEILWAEDAISAISLIVQEKPDLILLDIGLPGGDGFLVMERMKSLAYRIPVIMLSAFDPDLYHERALRAGAFAFLQKPADNEELLSTINTALSEVAADSRHILSCPP